MRQPYKEKMWLSHFPLHFLEILFFFFFKVIKAEILFLNRLFSGIC